MYIDLLVFVALFSYAQVIATLLTCIMDLWMFLLISSQDTKRISQEEKQEDGIKTKRMSEEISPTGEAIFELFRTYDGEEYTVYVREDGKRFYVDFEEQVHVHVRYERLFYSPLIVAV